MSRSIRNNMLYLKKIICFLLFPFLALTSRGQDNIIYFLGNTPNSYTLNPARHNDSSKFYLNFPLLSGFNFSLENSFSLSKLAIYENDEIIFNVGSFLSNLPEKNYFTQELSIPIFEVQYRRNNSNFSFYITERQFLSAGFERNLIQLLYEGNSTWQNSPFSTALGLDLSHYREYAFGYAHTFADKFTAGVRVKALTGLLIFNTQHLTFDIEAARNLEHVDFKMNGLYNVSAPFVDETFFDEFSLDQRINYSGYFTNMANPGLSFDVGFTFKPIPALELSASIVDLGYIKWEKSVFNVAHTANFKWKLMDYFNLYDPQDEDFTIPDPMQIFGDSIAEYTDFKYSHHPFSTKQPSKIFIAANYRLNRLFDLGLVDRIYLYNNQTTNALTFSGNLKLGSVFSLSAGYTIVGQSYNNLAIGTSLKLGPVQLYCLTGNILGLKIMDAKYFNFKWGMNILIDKK
jgi:hypothetical protein